MGWQHRPQRKAGLVWPKIPTAHRNKHRTPNTGDHTAKLLRQQELGPCLTEKSLIILITCYLLLLGAFAFIYPNKKYKWCWLVWVFITLIIARTGNNHRYESYLHLTLDRSLPVNTPLLRWRRQCFASRNRKRKCKKLLKEAFTWFSIQMDLRLLFVIQLCCTFYFYLQTEFGQWLSSHHYQSSFINSNHHCWWIWPGDTENEQLKATHTIMLLPIPPNADHNWRQ